MIRAVVRRDAAGEAVSLELRGHAGKGPAGFDLVCAAVSAVVQTAALGLTQVAGAHPAVESRSGYFRCVLPVAEAGTPGARAILETALAGLRDIAEEHREALRIEEHGEER